VVYSQPVNDILSASDTEDPCGIFVVADSQGPQEEAFGRYGLYLLGDNHSDGLLGVRK
jgi:hypothetical protein